MKQEFEESFKLMLWMGWDGMGWDGVAVRA